MALSFMLRWLTENKAVIVVFSLGLADGTYACFVFLLLCREQSSRAISVIAGVDVCLFPL
jgi:hypothetical protein